MSLRSRESYVPKVLGVRYQKPLHCHQDKRSSGTEGETTVWVDQQALDDGGVMNKCSHLAVLLGVVSPALDLAYTRGSVWLDPTLAL